MSSTHTIARPAVAASSVPSFASGEPSLASTRVSARLGIRSRAPRVLHAIAPSKLAGAETFLLRLLRRPSLDTFVANCITSRSRANDELLAANVPFERLGIGGKGNLLAIPRLAAAARR